jgi:hypothetical protein
MSEGFALWNFLESRQQRGVSSANKALVGSKGKDSLMHLESSSFTGFRVFLIEWQSTFSSSVVVGEQINSPAQWNGVEVCVAVKVAVGEAHKARSGMRV